MRSLSVIIAMLVSGTISAQAYNCGLFGIITDDYNNPYVGRFDNMMDSVQLESAATCEVLTAPIEVIDIRNGKRWTTLWVLVKHEDFDDVGYKIKYPSGSWDIRRLKANVPDSEPWWPVPGN